MAKKSIIARNLKREKIVLKYAAKRAELKEAIYNIHLSAQEREIARLKMQELPRNSSAVRLRRRCKLTGRPRGVYRKFGMARNKLREHAMRGNIPGVVKSSW